MPKRILRRLYLIWNQKFVPTQQLWQSTRPNAAPSPPHPHYTADSPPGCGVGCYLLVFPPIDSPSFPPSSLPSVLTVFFSKQCYCTCICLFFCARFLPLFFFFLLYATIENLCQKLVKCLCVQLCAWRGLQKKKSTASWELQDTRQQVRWVSVAVPS